MELKDFVKTTIHEVMDAVDAAYHAKYDRYGKGIVGTVVGPRSWPTTLRLVPRRS